MDPRILVAKSSRAVTIEPVGNSRAQDWCNIYLTRSLAASNFPVWARNDSNPCTRAASLSLSDHQGTFSPRRMTKIDPTSRLNVTQPTMRWIILRTRVHSIDILSKSHSAVSSVKKMKKHRYRNIHNVGLGREQREKRRDRGKRQDAEMLFSQKARNGSIWLTGVFTGIERQYQSPTRTRAGNSKMSMQLLGKVYSPHRSSRAPQDILIVSHLRLTDSRTQWRREVREQEIPGLHSLARKSTGFPLREEKEGSWTVHGKVPAAGIQSDEMRCDTIQPSAGLCLAYKLSGTEERKKTPLRPVHFALPPGPRIQTGVGANHPTPSDGSAETPPEFARRDTVLHALRKEAMCGGARRIPTTEVAGGADDMRAQAKGKEKEMEAQQKGGAAGGDGERRPTQKPRGKLQTSRKNVAQTKIRDLKISAPPLCESSPLRTRRSPPDRAQTTHPHQPKAVASEGPSSFRLFGGYENRRRSEGEGRTGKGGSGGEEQTGRPRGGATRYGEDI
ncbi:hypothetical protein K438DRAFT_1944907 [Mycena galopus ATCC 62051]|nr:hypothetical protein K438DRAFT_1944907 [Mycena galopus ATCC 62051]